MSISHTAAMLLGENIASALIRLGEDASVDRIVRIGAVMVSGAVSGALPLSLDGTGHDAIVAARHYLDEVVPFLAPAQLPFEVFKEEAQVTRLQDHGRAAEVFFRGKSLGYVDGVGDAGIHDMHGAEVNNALCLNSPDIGQATKRPLPALAAIRQHPKLMRVPDFELPILASEVVAKKGFRFSFNDSAKGSFAGGHVDRNGVMISDEFVAEFAEVVHGSGAGGVAQSPIERLRALSSAEAAMIMSAQGRLSLATEAKADPVMTAALQRHEAARLAESAEVLGYESVSQMNEAQGEAARRKRVHADAVAYQDSLDASRRKAGVSGILPEEVVWVEPPSEMSRQTPVTVYLTARPNFPVRGVRDEDGNVRVGGAGGFDFSRVLTEHEVMRVDVAEHMPTDNQRKRQDQLIAMTVKEMAPLAPVALVTFRGTEYPYFLSTEPGTGEPVFFTKLGEHEYGMKGDASTSDHIAALKVQYGEAAVRPWRRPVLESESSPAP